MATERRLNTFVPYSLLVPHYSISGSQSPIWKLSAELFLSIAEYLDGPTCLTFSQTCRPLMILSKERSIYWRSALATFPHGLLPRVAPLSSFTGEELREVAIKVTNLEWRWENKRPTIVRRTPLEPPGLHSEKYFVPAGSRWLFIYGQHRQTRQNAIYVHDLIKNQRTFKVKLLSSKRSSEVSVFSCTFYDLLADQTGDKATIVQTEIITMKGVVTSCTFQEGLIGTCTADQVFVQQWDKPETRVEVPLDALWAPMGVQIARDRLIQLEGRQEETSLSSWRIRAFDLEPVRRGESVPETSEEEGAETPCLWLIDSADILEAPVQPFFAPYWEDRIDEPGIHLGFKMLMLIHTRMGENLWHCDLRLDTIQTPVEGKDGSTPKEEEKLTVEGPYIVGATRDERPTQFVEGFALGPRASRIVWTDANGWTRIRSDWTDETISSSRLMDTRGMPMSIPRLLAFDESVGMLIFSDTPTHHSIYWLL